MVSTDLCGLYLPHLSEIYKMPNSVYYKKMHLNHVRSNKLKHFKRKCRSDKRYKLLVIGFMVMSVSVCSVRHSIMGHIMSPINHLAQFAGLKIRKKCAVCVSFWTYTWDSKLAQWKLAWCFWSTEVRHMKSEFCVRSWSVCQLPSVAN